MNIPKVLIGRVSCVLVVLAAAWNLLAQTDGANTSSVTFTTLHSFVGTDGESPTGSLVQATNGDLYGSTSLGTADCTFTGGCGTIFKTTRDGTLSTVYRFCTQGGSVCSDGNWPWPLTQATNGDLYGTTQIGGPTANGTAFKLSPSGAYTLLYSFCTEPDCGDGAFPAPGLLQAANGNLYGTTVAGGAYNFGADGTIFKITPSGSLTTIHSFCAQADCADGSEPSGPLVQGPDGNLYGTTQEGGATCPYSGGCGTVFRITPDGTLTTIYKFCSQTGCTDGVQPRTGVILAANGDLYGTTTFGGDSSSPCILGGCGTIFKITPSGTLVTLYTFCKESGCPDGGAPSGLVEAPSGDLYGTTLADVGTIFKITPAGTLTTLHTFCAQAGCPDGEFPAELAQGTDGKFYGTTLNGGGSANCTGGCGTVFSLSTGESPFVKTRPLSGVVGEIVGILGYGLTGATSVTFNGTPATILYDAATVVYAKVPTGATTGKVEVVTPKGTLTSNMAFEVAP